MTTGTDTVRSSTLATGSWMGDGRKANASRLRGAGRRRSIPHLMLGALLVVACAAAFVVVSLSSGDRLPVLVMARAVSVGQVLTAQDLRQANVTIDPGMSVVDAGQAASIVGRTMATGLPAGALLVPEAVGGAAVPVAGQAIAALSLKPGQFPPEVSPGAHVLVVFVSGQAGGSASAGPPAAETSMSWPAVVTNVTAPPNEQATVVSVQLGEAAARQVAAVPAGQLSLVMVSAGGGR